jgi:hypothetical protein
MPTTVELGPAFPSRGVEPVRTISAWLHSDGGTDSRASLIFVDTHNQRILIKLAVNQALRTQKLNGINLSLPAIVGEI